MATSKIIDDWCRRTFQGINRKNGTGMTTISCHINVTIVILCTIDVGKWWVDVYFSSLEKTYLRQPCLTTNYFTEKTYPVGKNI